MIRKTSKNTIKVFTTLIEIIKLFKKQNNVFHGKKCLRCSEFLPSSRCKVNHDFLSHHDAGKNVFEEKPVNYTKLGGIHKYKITFAQHSHNYYFYNAEKLVDDFLLKVKNRVGLFSFNGIKILREKLLLQNYRAVLLKNLTDSILFVLSSVKS